MPFRQALPNSVKIWVDTTLDLTNLIDDRQVANGLDVWVEAPGVQHGVWRLDQQSALPLNPGVVATFSGVGRWIYFGAGGGGGGGGGGGVPNASRVDCSVNSARVAGLYDPTSVLHVQTAGNVPGGYNGPNIGNKSILGYRTADGLALSAWSGFEYTWKNLAPFVPAPTPLLVYANMVVDINGDGTVYKIFVVDPAAVPLLNLCTTVVNGDGSRTTKHVAATQNVLVVGDLAGVVPAVNLGPGYLNHGYALADILAVYPSARFKEAPSGDAGLPNLQVTPAFMLITGDSVTNAILTFSVAFVAFNGVVV